ncbi:MAG: hypothetical protein PHQ27_11295, partial [Victivallales bacterium]|nr:hypothetical protein [Victivallales bacterium]
TEVLIVDAAFAERLPAVRAQCPGLRHVVLIGPEQKAASDQSEHAQSAIHFEALIAGQPTTPPVVFIKKNIYSWKRSRNAEAVTGNEGSVDGRNAETHSYRRRKNSAARRIG